MSALVELCGVAKSFGGEGFSCEGSRFLRDQREGPRDSIIIGLCIVAVRAPGGSIPHELA